MTTLPTYEERLKSFKTMIYKPEQIPQLAEDLPSKDILHILFSVIGFNKLLSEFPYDVECHFFNNSDDITHVINLFFQHPNMEVKLNAASLLSLLIVKSSNFAKIFFDHDIHKYAIGLFSLEDNQLNAYVLCILGNMLIEPSLTFEESLLTTYIKKFLDLSKSQNTSKQLKTDLVWALANCARRKPTDPEAFVPCFNYFGKLLTLIKNPSTDREFSNDVLWALLYLSDAERSNPSDNFIIEDESRIIFEKFAHIRNKPYIEFARLAMGTIANLISTNSGFASKFLENKEFLSLVYMVKTDEAEYFPIFQELYNGLGKLQDMDLVRTIIKDDRAGNLQAALEESSDLELRFKILRFISLIGKFGSSEDILFLLNKNIISSVFKFLGYTGSPLRKNDIRACLRFFMYILKKAKATGEEKINIAANDKFEFAIKQELDKHNPEDITEVTELREYLGMN